MPTILYSSEVFKVEKKLVTKAMNAGTNVVLGAYHSSNGRRHNPRLP